MKLQNPQTELENSMTLQLDHLHCGKRLDFYMKLLADVQSKGAAVGKPTTFKLSPPLLIDPSHDIELM